MNKICFVNTANFWGGGEKLFLDYAVLFIDAGYDVVIITKKDSPLFKNSKLKDIATIGVRSGKTTPLNLLFQIRLIRLFKKLNTDTVFFILPGDIKSFGFAARIAKVENIVYLRGLAKKIRATLLNKFIFNKILTHIIANSEETKRMILFHQSQYLSSDKVKVIYHGIDFSKVLFKKLMPIKRIGKDKFVIANAGRLEKQKGQLLLIEIAEYLKNMGLIFKIQIAGTGPLKKHISDVINSKGLSDFIELMGFVEDMDDFYSQSDVFVLTSSFEGFGFVIVEAMAHKLPVIAFNVSSNPEIINHNETGFLIEKDNTHIMATMLHKLAIDTKLRQEMGQNAFEYARKHFDIKERAKEIIKYISEAE